MAGGTEDHPLKGGGVTLHRRQICGLGCPLQPNSKTGTVLYSLVTTSIVSSIKYQVPGPGGDRLASKGPVNPYQAHRVPAATVTTTVVVAYTANIGVTRRPRWFHCSKATTEIHQATPGFPRPQAGGETPRVFPWAHHVHIHDASPEW